jgi:hypothetical protein
VRRRGALVALASLVAGCAGKQPLPVVAPSPPLHGGPITDLFAAAGLDWLVIARPSELLRAMGAPIARVLPPANLDKLSTHLGFDVRLADSLVVGGYGETTLYAVKVAHDGKNAEARFVERLTGDVVRGSEGSRIRRVSGVVGKTPRAFADLDESVVLFESGPTGPMKAAVAFAQEKLKRAKPALVAEPLASLGKRLEDAPLLAMAPRPPRGGWTRGAHGILPMASAIGVAATPEGDALRVRGAALGAWDEPPTKALESLSATIADLTGAPLGRLLGLDRPRVAPSYGGDRDAIRFEATVDATTLAEGLWAATSAELGELFGKRLRTIGKIVLRGATRVEWGRWVGMVTTTVAQENPHHDHRQQHRRRRLGVRSHRVRPAARSGVRSARPQRDEGRAGSLQARPGHRGALGRHAGSEDVG